MAGMLPGVECARRRRIHPSRGWLDSSICSSGYGLTRRSFYCLYTANKEFHFTPNSSSMHRRMMQSDNEDEKLEGMAKEAKERLDERLRAQRKSEFKRANSRDSVGILENEGSFMIQSENSKLHIFANNNKKNGLKRFRWPKLFRTLGLRERRVCDVLESV